MNNKCLQNKCTVIDLGLIEYVNAYHVQRECVARVQTGEGSFLLLCEHPAVITMGRTAKDQHILLSQEELRAQNINVEYIDRGGDITLHAPGQLVAYPILDLNHYGKDLHAYLHSLEDIVIDVCRVYGIDGIRSVGQTGVWIGRDKLASMGIGVSKWVSFHGIGLNVSTDLELFRLIKPCGLDVHMTSLEKILGTKIALAAVKNHFINQYVQRFDLVTNDI